VGRALVAAGAVAVLLGAALDDESERERQRMLA
jgi:hypothetical protein